MKQPINSIITGSCLVEFHIDEDCAPVGGLKTGKFFVNVLEM